MIPKKQTKKRRTRQRSEGRRRLVVRSKAKRRVRKSEKKQRGGTVDLLNTILPNADSNTKEYYGNNFPVQETDISGFFDDSKYKENLSQILYDLLKTSKEDPKMEKSLQSALNLNDIRSVGGLFKLLHTAKTEDNSKLVEELTTNEELNPVKKLSQQWNLFYKNIKDGPSKELIDYFPIEYSEGVRGKDYVPLIELLIIFFVYLILVCTETFIFRNSGDISVLMNKKFNMTDIIKGVLQNKTTMNDGSELEHTIIRRLFDLNYINPKRMIQRYHEYFLNGLKESININRPYPLLTIPEDKEKDYSVFLVQSILNGDFDEKTYNDPPASVLQDIFQALQTKGVNCTEQVGGVDNKDKKALNKALTICMESIDPDIGSKKVAPAASSNCSEYKLKIKELQKENKTMRSQFNKLKQVCPQDLIKNHQKDVDKLKQKNARLTDKNRELEQEKKTVEKTILTLKDEVQICKKQEAIRNKGYKEERDELSQALAKLKKHSSGINKYNQDIDNLRDEIKRLKEAAFEKNKECVSLKGDKDKLEKRIEVLDANNKTANQSLKVVQESVQKLRLSNDSFKKRLTDCANCESELKALRAENKKQETAITRAQKENETLKEHASTYRGFEKELEALREGKQFCDQVKEEYAQFKTDCNKVEKERDTLKEHASTYRGFEKELEALREGKQFCDQVKEEYAQFKKDCSKLEKERDTLKEHASTYRGFEKELEALREGKQFCDQVKEEYAQFKKEFTMIEKENQELLTKVGQQDKLIQKDAKRIKDLEDKNGNLSNEGKLLKSQVRDIQSQMVIVQGERKELDVEDALYDKFAEALRVSQNDLTQLKKHMEQVLESSQGEENTTNLEDIIEIVQNVADDISKGEVCEGGNTGEIMKLSQNFFKGVSEYISDLQTVLTIIGPKCQKAAIRISVNQLRYRLHNYEKRLSKLM